jgi:hypothetical protein
VGNSSIDTIIGEMLAALDIKEGDTVLVTSSDDNGLKIQAYDPELFGVLAVSEEIMDENCTMLQALT